MNFLVGVTVVSTIIKKKFQKYSLYNIYFFVLYNFYFQSTRLILILLVCVLERKCFPDSNKKILNSKFLRDKIVDISFHKKEKDCRWSQSTFTLKWSIHVLIFGHVGKAYLIMVSSNEWMPCMNRSVHFTCEDFMIGQNEPSR